MRLKNAYIVKCTGCTKDAEGNIIEIQAEYDPISKSGLEGANRKVKGTLHWVSADHCHKAQVRVYDRLFCVENPSADERDFRELLNLESLKTIEYCYVENYAADCKPDSICSSSASATSWQTSTLQPRTSCSTRLWV